MFSLRNSENEWVPESRRAGNGTVGKQHHAAKKDIKKAAPGRYQARRDAFCIFLGFQRLLYTTDAAVGGDCGGLWGWGVS